MYELLSRVQVLAELTDRNRKVLIPGFCPFLLPSVKTHDR